MREDLAKLRGQRRSFQGIVDRFGTKAGYKGVLETVLLRDIVDCESHKAVTDHLWFTIHKRFNSLNLKAGDLVKFKARVTSYWKGYVRRGDDSARSMDYRLSFPTDMKKLETVPGDKNQTILPVQ